MPDINMFHVMLDDAFQDILQHDPVLDELEKAKHDARTDFFEMMMCLSKTFAIDGTVVSCITPAIWAYLFAIKSPYTCDGKISELDTDVVLYILHNGIKSVDEHIIDHAAGFCRLHGIDPVTAEQDIKTLIYISFRPLEMLSATTVQQEEPRFDLDWLTHIVSVVSPMTGKTSDDVIYNTSLCECLYYLIQEARKYDYKSQIRRRNPEEINQAIWERTMELGRKYWQEHYAVDDSAN